MHRKRISFLISFLAIFLGNSLQAQEKLVSVSSNPVLMNRTIPMERKTGNADTLHLPFIDDFSNTSVYPDSLHWTDHTVFINNSFGINPPTYGVATFDALDSTGAIYKTATTEAFIADALTSRPIDLFLPGDTTVYLSFYYQPQGLGDQPETEDSLIVEFYAPDQDKWYSVWSAPGSASADFKLVMINITDSRFLQKGFRFRFRSYASLAPALEASLKVNADHWNIDYVYLNNYRHYGDTNIFDVSLLKPVGNLLQNYTAMPWAHFKAAGLSAVKAIFGLNLNNLSSEKRKFTPTLTISPVWTSGAGFEKTYTEDEIKPFETLAYDAAFNYGFTSADADSALFQVTLNLNQPLTDWIPGNDKISNQQVFTDYYSYDDGSSEAGYGLSGEGTRNGKVAVRFKNTVTADSLCAVDLYFNRSFADVNKKYFNIGIWADDNNQPGELIYSQDGAVPEFNGINGFQRIKLKTANLAPGTYYIGIIQTTRDFLNIGYDRQNDHRQDLFYNISGTWVNSRVALGGTLMIRPVFANKSKKSGIDETLLTEKENSSIKIYPNPASDLIHFECNNQSDNRILILMDMSGKEIRRVAINGSTGNINISDIRNGFYLVRVQSKSGVIARQKLMILHE